MELRQMEYFIAVCDYGGVTLAAEALFLTPQALSKSIRRLEEELGCPLFVRGKSGLTLTPFGEKALEEMRRLVGEYQNVKQRLRQVAAQENGLIRLSCGHGVPNALPLDALRTELLPGGITLDVVELPDLLAEEMVQREMVDLGLSVGLPQFPALFQYTLLRRFRLCAVVSKRHPFAARRSLSVRDLAGEKVVAKNAYFSSYHTLEEEAQRQGITLTYALQSPDEIRWLRLVESGEGVGIGVPFMDNSKLSSSQNIVSLPFEEELPWEVYLITRKGHYLSPAAQALVAQLRSWQALSS